MSRSDMPKPISQWTLEAFPFRVTVGCRHTDLDVQKAINNVALAEMFEEARTQYSVARKLKPAFDPNRRVLESLTILFGADGRYPGHLDIGVGVAAIGPDGWTLRLLATQGDAVVAACDCDFTLALDGNSVALPEALSAILENDRLTGF